MAIKIESSLSVTNSGTLLGHEENRSLSIGELTRRLELMFPPHDAEDWDRTGLLVGDSSEGVAGVSVALDPTPKAVELAQSSGSNVLLT
uniref:Nif3-like dinuclear metal center hexameric protein n=1 Tax=uncultured Slackia sp. TaxID=665903 RepID=UPI0025FA49DC